MFPDDGACARYLEDVRWRDGFVCPHCDGAEDYIGLCGTCGHTDDPDAFGFGEIEWD
jgi:hypothetical protein